MNWKSFKAKLEDENSFFDSLPWISKENQNLLSLYKNKYRLSMYEVVLECHLMTSFEIAKALAKSLDLTFFHRLEDSRFELDRSLFKVSDCLKYRVLPEKSASNIKLWLVDPWNESFQQSMEKVSSTIEWSFGIISQEDFDNLLPKFVSIEEPIA